MRARMTVGNPSSAFMFIIESLSYNHGENIAIAPEVSEPVLSSVNWGTVLLSNKACY